MGTGLAIGAALYTKAKKEGMMLCLKETSTATKTSRNQAILDILGLLLLAGLLYYQ